MAYFLKGSYFSPELKKMVFRIHEVTETTIRNHGKAKEKKMQVPGLKINLNLADFAPCDGPTTKDEFWSTRFLITGSPVMLKFAEALGIDLKSNEKPEEIKIPEPQKPKDNPELREKLKGMDLPQLRQYCQENGWNEEEYGSFRQAGILMEKIILRSLETEVVK